MVLNRNFCTFDLSDNTINLNIAMAEYYFEDKKFRDTDYTGKALKIGEYVSCTFVNCDFSNSILSGITFMECAFENCNLSMAKVHNTAWKDVDFKDCKLLGVNFSLCHQFLFSVTFERCVLDLASFYKLKIKETTFKNCSLEDVDFVEADLTGSVFDNCNLNKSMFENTILEKTDFRTAFNYAFDPELNRIKKAKFSGTGIAGLLYKYDIEIE